MCGNLPSYPKTFNRSFDLYDSYFVLGSEFLGKVLVRAIYESPYFVTLDLLECHDADEEVVVFLTRGSTC